MTATAEPPARDPALAAIADRLAEPFDAREMKWKAQTVKGNRALAVAFIDARLVQDRLDEVLGVENWQDLYDLLPDGSVMCRLRVKLGGRWITKTDVGSTSEQPDAGDRLKAAFSDALKRAAVKLGIGRYLYRLPHQWVDYDPVKKQLAQTPSLPAFAVPKGRGQQPAPAQKPQQPPATGGQHSPPAADANGVGTRRAALSEAMKAANWSWAEAMAWLSQTYPQDAVRYVENTRFLDVEPARCDHLIRHLNTLAVRGK